MQPGLFPGAQAVTAPSQISVLSLASCARWSLQIDLRTLPEREADPVLVKVNSGVQIGFQRRFQLEPRRVLQQVETVVGGADRVCLMQDQQLAFVKPLQRAGDRECQDQAHEGEYGAFDGIQSGYGRSALASKVARAEPAPQIHQGE